MDVVLAKLSKDFKNMAPIIRKRVKMLITEALEDNPDWMNLIPI